MNFLNSQFHIRLGCNSTQVSHGISFFNNTLLNIFFFKDPNTEKWYLNYGDEVVGYWPYEILYYLKSRAIIAQWGGDVYSKNTKGVEPHTTTAMGSGDFASGLWGSACFIQNIYVLDTSFKLFYPEWVYVNSEEPMCYSVRNFKATGVSMPTFYFGGPGRNQNCP